MAKNSYLRARCTEAEKYQVTHYLDSHDITESNFVLAAVQTALKCNKPQNQDMQMHFFYQVQYNSLRNQLLNEINLDPSIPKKTKDRIRKVIDEYEFGSFDIY